MANLFGRAVVGYKLNNSGGGVIKGDVVVPDTSADNAFTTTTSAAVTTGVWVADETIANAATGRVVLSGHVTLVNVSASVTRGHTGATHTVAKQAASTGATTRSAGTFCKFTTGGTTPEADIWPVDLLGSSLTNPMTTAGDIIVGGASGAPARLAAGTAGYPLVGGGAGVASSYAVAGKFHGCHVFHSAAQTAAPLLFDSEVFDTDAYHSTSSNTSRITIPAGLGGYYEFVFTSLGTSEVATFTKNVGATQITGRIYNVTNGYYLLVSHPVALVAGDYVECSGGAASWGHASVFNAQSQFSCKLLGT